MTDHLTELHHLRRIAALVRLARTEGWYEDNPQWQEIDVLLGVPLFPGNVREANYAFIDVPLEDGGTVRLLVRGAGPPGDALYACTHSGRFVRSEACPNHPVVACVHVGYEAQ